MAASLLVVDTGTLGVNSIWLNRTSNSVLKSNVLKSGPGQQPQQPQQDYKKWLKSALDKDYDQLPPALRPKKEVVSSSPSHSGKGKNGQNQNVTQIIEMVSKLLDSVGKNFIPSTSVLSSLKDLIKPTFNGSTMSTNGTMSPTTVPVLKAAAPTGLADRSTVEKLQSELDLLKYKLYTSLGRHEDKRVEADMAQIINQMREQVN